MRERRIVRRQRRRVLSASFVEHLDRGEIGSGAARERGSECDCNQSVDPNHAVHCISEYTETRAKNPALAFSLKIAILLVSSHHSGLHALPERLCNFRLYIIEGGISRHDARDKVWPQFVDRLDL